MFSHQIKQTMQLQQLLTLIYKGVLVANTENNSLNLHICCELNKL
jgi:hypothetical protein